MPASLNMRALSVIPCIIHKVRLTDWPLQRLLRLRRLQRLRRRLQLLLRRTALIAMQLEDVTLCSLDVHGCTDRPLSTHSARLLASCCRVVAWSLLIERWRAAAVPNNPGWTLRI